MTRCTLLRTTGLLLGLAAGAVSSSLAQPRYLGSTPNAEGKKAKSYPDVDEKLQTARVSLDAAMAALGKKDRGAAKKSLEKAESTLEQALKNNPTSRGSADTLGKVYFYQGEAGDKDSYEKATKFLNRPRSS